MSPTVKEKKEPGFEARLQRLQDIVSRLEQGELPLAESVALYKEGMEHSRRCREQLDKARHDIEVWSEGQAGPAGELAGLAAAGGDEDERAV